MKAGGRWIAMQRGLHDVEREQLPVVDKPITTDEPGELHKAIEAHSKPYRPRFDLFEATRALLADSHKAAGA